MSVGLCLQPQGVCWGGLRCCCSTGFPLTLCMGRAAHCSAFAVVKGQGLPRRRQCNHVSRRDRTGERPAGGLRQLPRWDSLHHEVSGKETHRRGGRVPCA